MALSAERLAEWMASDLSKLDLLVIQIDGLHIGNDLVLVAALGIDGEGHKHPLGLVEGATENVFRWRTASQSRRSPPPQKGKKTDLAPWPARDLRTRRSTAG